MQIFIYILLFVLTALALFLFLSIKELNDLINNVIDTRFNHFMERNERCNVKSIFTKYYK